MFLELTKLPESDPAMGHLVVMPDRYEVVERLVSRSAAGSTDAERAALLIRERFIANYIFTLFEYALYQRSRASWFSPEKRAFSEEVLNYFTSRVLRNPRLLWYWSSQGGGLSTYYEISTRQYYDDRVLHNSADPLQQRPDPLGPFGSPPQHLQSVRK